MFSVISKRFKQLGGLLAIAGVSLLHAGCGGSTDGRVAIGGEVVFDGAPLKLGTIEFQPVDASGVVTGGVVTDGKFAVTAEQGPKPGKYKVIITETDTSAAVVEEAPGDSTKIPIPKQRVPAKYNTKTELQVDVPPKGDKAMKFTLDAK